MTFDQFSFFVGLALGMPVGVVIVWATDALGRAHDRRP